MDSKKLIELKVKISCKNNLAYQDIAYLVDNPDFLSRLPQLRDEYRISKLLPLNKFKDWWSAKIRDDLRVYGVEGKMLSEAKRLFGNKGKKSTDNEIFDSMPYHQRFDWETTLLTRKFNRPSYFHLIIKHVVVCGEVDDNSWQPTYAMVLPPELPVLDSDLPEVAIIVSPMSRTTDVERVFKTEVLDIYKREQWKFKYKTTAKRDPAINIVRDRNWYWLSLEGKKPGDIYDAEFCDPGNPPPKHLENFNIDSISKAIDRYVEKLQDKF